MSRIMHLSEADKKDLVSSFLKYIEREWDGESDTKYTIYTETEAKATVQFTSEAWKKMNALVDNYDTEVAWHGFVERIDDSTFLITDIVVYPQIVTAATVDTDQMEYEHWLQDLGPEKIRKLRFQGHSHVRMRTSPSPVDIAHQKSIVEELGDDDFYIFAICNQTGNIWVKIFDTVSNIVYSSGDISIEVEGGQVIDAFLQEIKPLVKNKPREVSKKCAWGSQLDEYPIYSSGDEYVGSF